MPELLGVAFLVVALCAAFIPYAKWRMRVARDRAMDDLLLEVAVEQYVEAFDWPRRPTTQEDNDATP